MTTGLGGDAPDNVIYEYTDAQAVEDGIKVDLTEWAREAGFTRTVYVTRTVWDRLIEWADEDTQRQTHQDISRRAHDVLHMAALAAGKVADDWFAEFDMLAIPRDGKARQPQTYRLWAVCDAGGVTIMFPEDY